MGKVLRVLVIIIMLLGIAALFMAAENFKKREVLIGRTHAFEEMFVKLARTIEAGDPPEVPQPAYPQRDLSPVTSREVENPERSAFWDAYNHKLEPAAQPVPTLDYSSQEKRLQLREFYRTDPATGGGWRVATSETDGSRVGTPSVDVQGLELRVRDGLGVHVQPQVPEQRLEHPQRTAGPQPPGGQVGELPPPQGLVHPAGPVVAQAVREVGRHVGEVVAQVPGDHLA